MSQGELSERSGVPQPTISAIERSHREPSTATLRKLAAALNVGVADFFAEADALVRLEQRMKAQAEEADRLREAIELPPDDAFPAFRAGQFVGAYRELSEEYEALKRTGDLTEPVRRTWERLDAAFKKLRPSLEAWKGPRATGDQSSGKAKAS